MGQQWSHLGWHTNHGKLRQIQQERSNWEINYTCVTDWFKNQLNLVPVNMETQAVWGCWKSAASCAYSQRTHLNMEIWRHWHVCAGVVSTSWWLSVLVTSSLQCLFLSICTGEFKIPCHPVSSKRKTRNHFSHFETTDRERVGWGGEYWLKVLFQYGWLTVTLTGPCVSAR